MVTIDLACEQALHLRKSRVRGWRKKWGALPFLRPSRLCESVTRSRLDRFARPNWRACQQATIDFKIATDKQQGSSEANLLT